MSALTAPHDTLTLDISTLATFTFRPFQGQADFPRLLNVIQKSKAADQFEDADTLESLTNFYSHLTNCDLNRDFIIAEAAGQVVAYGRVWWFDEDATADRIYGHVAFALPEWRGQGLGRALLSWLEDRARAVAATHTHTGPRFFQAWGVSDKEIARRKLLERAGYAPIRYFYTMVRPTLDDIPDAPLPPGLEVRPVQTEHLRAIWDASVEAFRDHWGFSEPTEDDYQSWLTDPVEFQPEVWKIAWDGEQVAGMVRGYIHHEQNKQFNRLRGWTENIAVCRPWRKRGLARALMAENLRELKARGMTEAALGVDTENPTGALRVYESLSFRAVEQRAVYRKPLT